jgi:hypothetical protein
MILRAAGPPSLSIRSRRLGSVMLGRVAQAQWEHDGREDSDGGLVLGLELLGGVFNGCIFSEAAGCLLDLDDHVQAVVRVVRPRGGVVTPAVGLSPV